MQNSCLMCEKKKKIIMVVGAQNVSGRIHINLVEDALEKGTGGLGG